jgi:plasmid stabilization system protein ParE
VRVRFLRFAQAELREAVRYYELVSPSLGADFLVEITAALNRIVEFPAAWPKVDQELRRYRVGRFSAWFGLRR